MSQIDAAVANKAEDSDLIHLTEFRNRTGGLLPMSSIMRLPFLPKCCLLSRFWPAGMACPFQFCASEPLILFSTDFLFPAKSPQGGTLCCETQRS